MSRLDHVAAWSLLQLTLGTVVSSYPSKKVGTQESESYMSPASSSIGMVKKCNQHKTRSRYDDKVNFNVFFHVFPWLELAAGATQLTVSGRAGELLPRLVNEVRKCLDTPPRRCG